ncbi:hypothetical protein DRQ25_01575 [Candidatus Fermentibacteria bacterium]|nr:MAG: hypothetical protein DRQ25_01575 [Candidatus Fermentibacteria bacterium]
MPIAMEAFRKPYWIKYEEGATLARDDSLKWMDYSQQPRRYRGGTYPQAGYNPKHNSTRVEQVRLDSDSITLKGFDMTEGPDERPPIG